MSSLPLAIETPRLVLRQWRAADRAPFAELNADPRVMACLLPLSRAESDALADRLAAGIDEYGWGCWAVEAPGVAPFVGFVGIKPLAGAFPFAPAVEAAWRLAHRHWGKGYALEAARAALRVGFEQVGLPEIVAMTVPANTRSRAVMRRLGMHQDAQEFDHPGVPDGHPLRRHVLYRLGRDDWRARCARPAPADEAPVPAA
ncbi:GCN5 family acetyltransferase [Achromobacter sp. DMS1]|uniref:GNAT family N-acetyltransferase n=1 Tax=Achromobacter sp. DMS1 TaxID=1688405 RepID=UPI00069E1B97|nr:GNAT family N-acetyltransferase [Achromobacter sp. DMS1]KOF55035.1 GCN5 family acetyltransferase [Achromobacter sp. DMS1]